ncbi:MAG: hypothetical protein KF678_03635 [Phycisphaeraceae bacterium]|nr:hypothetical protein [Phycisphaeraceae bacterium]
MGRDFEIKTASGPRSCRVWLLEQATWQPVFNGASIAAIRHGQPAFLGDVEPGRPPGLEGHFCQWLFILSRIYPDAAPLTVRLPPDGARLTLLDLVHGAQSLCHGASDLSWALPVFCRWGRGTWTNRFGKRYTLDSLAETHLRQEDVSTACFGTHWRMGIACSVAESADRFSRSTRRQLRDSLRRLIEEARDLCNPDGRFRLEPSPPGGPPFEAVVSFQAHTLEWLMVALPAEAVRSEPWVNQAIARLLADIGSPNHLTYGTRCHAATALRAYLSKTDGP